MAHSSARKSIAFILLAESYDIVQKALVTLMITLNSSLFRLPFGPPMFGSMMMGALVTRAALALTIVDIHRIVV